MKHIFFNLGIVIGVLMGFQTETFAGGDEVIVIYNSRVPESKEVADYYAQRRNVPTNQIFGFDLSTNLTMTRVEFRENLEKPLAHQLEAANIWQIRSQTVPATGGRPAHTEWRVKDSKIRYAVVCYGVPVRILKDEKLKEELPADMRPEFKRDEACVDSDLACLPLIEQRPLLTGPLANPVYGMTNAETLNPQSGVLLVARLDGPNPEIARHLVDKAIEAENVGMWGRAYFDLMNTTNTGLKLGDEWLANAAEICRRLGFETTVDTNMATFAASFPLSHVGIYCGWHDQNVSGPFALPTVEFMPGAFAYHLHSFSAGDIRSTTQNWVGALLAKGATITMGSVDEPYLPGTPNIAVFLADLIYGRYTFGEAAYASQMWISWQTIVIGDPLYRPFGKSPETLLTELDQQHSKYLEWAVLRLLNLNQIGLHKSPAALAALLEQMPVLTNSAVLTEKLAEFYDEQGKPTSTIDAYEKALQREPSPEQRVRLRLTLGEKLLADKRQTEAVEDYRKLLSEAPNYPGRAMVEAKITALTETNAGPSEINATNKP